MVKEQPTDTEILDWIERERADVMPHTEEDGTQVFGVSFDGDLMAPMIEWAPTIREAAIKAMGRGKK